MGRRATMMRGAAVLGAGLLMPILPVPARAQQQSAAADSAEAYYRLGRELLARGEARIRSKREDRLRCW